MNTAPATNTAQITKISRRAKRVFSGIILWVFLGVVAIFTLFPVLVTLFGSFKTNAELTAGATILPSVWHFSNYLDAWKQADFAKFTWNSLFISTFTTIGTLLLASMAAYVVDRRSFFGKSFYVSLQAVTMFISIGAVVIRPQFELMVKLHLNSSLWGIIFILISAHATTFFILIGFFKGIPRDLDEAAHIDGCNFFTVYWRIILPLLKPGLGVAALFAFRNAWNEYILPLVFTMTNPKLQTLTVGLADLRYGTTAATQTHLIMAGACLSILPILIVYVFANKSFMQVTGGSVKG
ncbi:carbohydrate ABC transporter permease [Bacillus sp. FJAT-28004]|uniref:carbohydrate ABC transporter permease n=1 Tax=Bacillus sp. FJAT-28004 TaxID=1679165 RepID=UPI000A6C74B0|nr:carbohydrate ABC transporter permease [Bacillus sp. FJAT-28004]